MKKILITMVLSFLAITSFAKEQNNLPDWQYVGYKIVHHMTLQQKHVEEFGFNKFEHSPIANYQSFVITPALDHYYSKAVADLRHGPVVVNTPARDDRYSSLEVFDMEHHAFLQKLQAQSHRDMSLLM